MSAPVQGSSDQVTLWVDHLPKELEELLVESPLRHPRPLDGCGQMATIGALGT